MALIINSSDIAILIPPSSVMILYAVVTGTSIAELFIAGIIPGVIICILFCIYNYFLARQKKMPVSARSTWQERRVALKKASLSLGFPIIIIGGIYTGVFTPTEAAGILVLYAIIICVVILRVVKWQDLFQSCAKRTAEFASMILVLVGCGFILALVGSQLRIGPTLVTFAESVGLGPVGIIVLMLIVLNVLGMFIPASTIVVITAPIFHPLATSVGIDGIWLGVFYIMCGEMAVLTPPVGVCMYTISGVSGIPMFTVIKG